MPWSGELARKEPVGCLVGYVGTYLTFSGRAWPVLRTTGGPVDLDRHTARAGPRFDQFERHVPTSVEEPSRALADDHGEYEQVHLIYKVVVEQPPGQSAAAVHLQLASRLGFQLADSSRDFTGEDSRVCPSGVGECGRCHVLG